MPTVYMTGPAEAAPDIARSLLERRLAACVNIVECRSIYRWDGEIVDDDEVVLLAKTTAEAYDRLVDHVTDIHPYSVPCIERFDESDVLPGYADWIRAETDGVDG